MSTPHGKFRYLTAGEIIYCRLIFGDAIEYSRVKVYNKKWMPMQRSDVVMTPNGNIYYPDGFKEDFSVGGASDADLQLFMHEMTHVWQYQNGYNVKLNGILSFKKSRYSYDLIEGKRLSDYNMEAQADLLADYFLLLKFGDIGAVYLSEKKYRCNDCSADLLLRYKAVLADFILNPHAKSNLPGGRERQQNGRGESWSHGRGAGHENY